MLTCGCGQQAAAACRRQKCGRCCIGCDKHPRTLPPAGEPGSCECGQVASPACDHWLCARCCQGCSRHACAESDDQSEDDGYDAYPTYRTYYRPQPGEPGSCSCGQVASPACDYSLCASCCRGCSRHAVEAETESEAGPQPGEPGSCSCGQIASPQCDYLVCANCCNGCSRHTFEAETESEAGPQPGEPGSCSCGQVASPACDFLLCASCCRGCSRHSRAAEPAAPAASQPGQPNRCSCGQTASPHCDYSLCANCCNGCSRHGYGSDAESDESNYMAPRGFTFVSPMAFVSPSSFPPLQQHHHQPQQQGLYCMCGRFADNTCSQRSCGLCCLDRTCTRHASAPSPAVPAASATNTDLDRVTAAVLSAMRSGADGAGIADTMRQVLPGASFLTPALAEALAERARVLSGRPNMAQQQPAGTAPAAAAGTSSAAAAATAAAAGPAPRSGQAGTSSTAVPGTAPAAAGSSSSSRDAAGDRVQRGPTGGDPGASSSRAAAAAAAAAGAGALKAAPVAAAVAVAAEEELFQLKHCVVCLDAPRSVLLLPCKHLVLCGGCSSQMQRQVHVDLVLGDSSRRQVLCPVCRVPAASMLPGIILP